MPIYSYECTACRKIFDEIRGINSKSGKALCPACANVSFKIPAIFNANIFKKREFADGTTTPDFVSTPRQEKAWLKSEGMTYDGIDRPNDFKNHHKKVRQEKSNTVMEEAFAKAYKEVDQGFDLHLGKSQSKTPEKLSFEA